MDNETTPESKGKTPSIETVVEKRPHVKKFLKDVAKETSAPDILYFDAVSLSTDRQRSADDCSWIQRIFKCRAGYKRIETACFLKWLHSGTGTKQRFRAPMTGQITTLDCQDCKTLWTAGVTWLPEHVGAPVPVGAFKLGLGPENIEAYIDTTKKAHPVLVTNALPLVYPCAIALGDRFPTATCGGVWLFVAEGLRTHAVGKKISHWAALARVPEDGYVVCEPIAQREGLYTADDIEAVIGAIEESSRRTDLEGIAIVDARAERIGEPYIYQAALEAASAALSQDVQVRLIAGDKLLDYKGITERERMTAVDIPRWNEF